VVNSAMCVFKRVAGTCSSLFFDSLATLLPGSRSLGCWLGFYVIFWGAVGLGGPFPFLLEHWYGSFCGHCFDRGAVYVTHGWHGRGGGGFCKQ
jgi:hypothetical protein